MLEERRSSFNNFARLYLIRRWFIRAFFGNMSFVIITLPVVDDADDEDEDEDAEISSEISEEPEDNDDG